MVQGVEECGGPCRGRTYGPLMKSPTKTYPRTLSKNNHQQKGKIRDGSPYLGSSDVRVFWHQAGTNYLPFSEKGPFAFPSLSDPRLQIFTDKGHLGKGRTFGHGNLKRLQHRHRRRVVGPD
jgi:hypothetical protein